MASLTAVELGADTCALARTNTGRGDVELLAAETLDPSAFPDIDALTAAVRDLRKSLKLPKRCRAVVWGLPDGATRTDPAMKPLIAPLVGAGFRVERVISPCNALAALSRLRMPRGDGATCWLAINRTGVAMVVVRPGTQLYAHSFSWDSTVGSSGSQARLLHRYSLVAFLAPEIRRAMNAAREKGSPVDAIVTCGNLPEIRSLTMPLIEELDVEVESLDSLDGLIVKPDATDRLSEIAASLRIACAAAIARPTRRWDESKRPGSAIRSFARPVAAVAVILAIAFIGWSWWTMTSAPPPAKAAPPAKTTAKQPSPKPTSTPASKQAQTRTQAAPAAVQKPGAPAVTATPSLPAKQEVGAKAPTRTEPPIHTEASIHTVPPPTPSAPLTKHEALPVAKQIPASPQQVPVPPQQAPAPAKQAPAPAKQAPAPAKQAAAPSQQATAPAKPAAAPGTAASKQEIGAKSTRGAEPAPSRNRLDAPPRAADKPDATPVRPASGGGPMPELLKDPVPRVTAILVSSDRRMATIDDGRIIAVGETVGKRVVVAIDERAVVLREPSGVQIRVGLGGRILAVERSER